MPRWTQTYQEVELERPLSLKQGQFQEDSRAGTRTDASRAAVFRRGLRGVVSSAVRAALGVGGHGEKEPPEPARAFSASSSEGPTDAEPGRGEAAAQTVVHRTIIQDSVQMSVRGYTAAHTFNKRSAAPLQGRRERFTETRQGDLGQRRDKPRREEARRRPTQTAGLRTLNQNTTRVVQEA